MTKRHAISGAEKGGGIGCVRSTASSTDLSRENFHSLSASRLTELYLLRVGYGAWGKGVG